MGAGDHCAANLDTGVVVCAESEAHLPAAVKEATGETMIYETAPTNAVAQGVSPTASYVLGIFYSYPNYGGRSFTATGGSPCTSAQYSFANLTDIGWNDDIDSFKSYSGCKTKIWEHANQGGASYGLFTNSSDVGVMKNQASSIRWAS